MKLSEEIDEKGILKLGMGKVMKSIHNLEKENEELKRQIELMKCCHNCNLQGTDYCKNYRNNYNVNICYIWELKKFIKD